MIRISPEEFSFTFQSKMEKFGLTPDKARRIAAIFTQSSLDGVYSHGTNKFLVFIDTIRKGLVDVNAVAEPISTSGPLERWEGHLGPGPLNAAICMDRCIELAKTYGMGAVALGNTNHWMRGGSYGWQAADAGCMAMCFSNTKPNMPPWGGLKAAIGNNPLIIAIPRSKGHFVLDIAMSQYSYGKLEQYQLDGNMLPYPGGFDGEGTLSQDPEAILESGLTLPIGFWKGSGLSIMLDMLASLLSKGRSTTQVADEEFGISQLFICFYLPALGEDSHREQQMDELVAFIKAANPPGEEKVRYPGEGTRALRKENEAHGIPVHPVIWERILAL